MIDATDDDILEVTRELGMNAGMRIASAFFGVTASTQRQPVAEDPEAWARRRLTLQSTERRLPAMTAQGIVDQPRRPGS